MIIEGILPAARERLITIDGDAPLVAAAILLRDPDADLVVVRDTGGVLAGVISKTDIVARSTIAREPPAGVASAVMTQAVIYCRPHNLLYEIWLVMKERQLKNIPILDRGSRPIGVLNARDALEALLEELECEGVLLREYVTCVGYH